MTVCLSEPIVARVNGATQVDCVGISAERDNIYVPVPLLTLVICKREERSLVGDKGPAESVHWDRQPHSAPEV